MMESNEKFTLGKSRQAAALARKAVSFQKRQTFTNLLPVAYGQVRFKVSQKFLIPEILYCSKENSMNKLNIPYWRVNDDNITITNGKDIFGSTLDEIKHVNYARVASFAGSQRPGASSATFIRPCVFWYGEDYPLSSLYEKSSGASTKYRRDSAYLAQPVGGWVGALSNPLNNASVTSQTINVFTNYQQRTWHLVSGEPNLASLIGEKPKQSNIDLIPFFQSPATPAFVPTNVSTGLLNTIPTKLFLNIDTVSGTGIKGANLIPVPWYNLINVSDDALDDLIADGIRDAIKRIANEDKSVLEGGANRNLTATSILFLKINKILDDLPHGAIYFKKIDHTNKKYSWIYHIGNSIQLTYTSNFPEAGLRQLIQQTQLDNAILRNSDVSKFSNAQITQGLRILPQLANTKLNIPIGSFIGGILYPFGVSFLLPIFAIVLVQEKENRIFMMMKMNGMTQFPYYISHYVTFLILYCFSALVFLISGRVGKLTLFTQTNQAFLALFFFIWGNNQISLAFFFSTFFNKSRLALVIVFLLVLCSVIVSLVVSRLFAFTVVPVYYMLWPPFAFYRALSLMNVASYSANVPAYSFSSLQPNSEITTILIFLIIEIPVYLLIAYYFQMVLPSEFGVRKQWHFPITDTIKSIKRMQNRNSGKVNNSEYNLATAIQVDEKETQFEDKDVKEERARVIADNFDSTDYPLVMKNMRKVYAGRGGAGPKLAVKDVTFAVEKGVTFGLLGPNGAGKTTLISILTGLYEASSGYATLSGYDIKANTLEVYKCIGICPQFDIQWEELTIGEHLYFYARLKGINAADEQRAVNAALKNVSLQAFEHRLTKGLSGGEKRRLSIAIALLGNPAVVFLDEPTTGLDPEVRRLIWNIVNESRAGRTIVLTTHSMEEAEALCQRIGIMAKGTLRCIANPTRLKEIYGRGFRIFANSLEENTGRVKTYLESIMPAGWTNIDSFATNVTYEFPAVRGALGNIFKDIESKKTEYGILDWGIGQTTLEEVFIKLISESDAAAEY
ncbi:hypothetical protein HDV02_004350 [Globomyces sp. JEL0801]|nr:hypothetical protein HDV02_004350 [Globomyces sp. JEL0801]